MDATNLAGELQHLLRLLLSAELLKHHGLLLRRHLVRHFSVNLRLSNAGADGGRREERAAGSVRQRAVTDKPAVPLVAPALPRPRPTALSSPGPNPANQGTYQ